MSGGVSAICRQRAREQAQQACLHTVGCFEGKYSKTMECRWIRTAPPGATLEAYRDYEPDRVYLCQRATPDRQNKLIRSTRKRWRKLNGFEELKAVVQGIGFKMVFDQRKSRIRKPSDSVSNTRCDDNSSMILKIWSPG